MVRRLLPLALGAALTGCASVSGFPVPIADPRQEDAEIAPYLKASAITDYENCADKVACRNTIIDARLRGVDLAFYRFQRKLYRQDTQVGLGSDVLTMTLDSVAAVTGTRGLAAGAGLLTGGRDAFQRQVASASLPLLFEEMIAQREEILLRIRQGQAMPVTAYSIFQALDDISEYQMAGSIPAAAAGLRASTGSAARTAHAKLDAFRTSSQTAAVLAPVAVLATPTTPQLPPVTTTPAPPAASFTAGPMSPPSMAPPIMPGSMPTTPTPGP